MRKERKEHILIPALIAAIAAYFGFKRKSESLSLVAKDLVNRAIDDQTGTNYEKQEPGYRRKRSRRSSRKSYRDRYYS